nr:MAG: RNA-dependent RNA polymerase [Permutotetraviridae sp.]
MDCSNPVKDSTRVTLSSMLEASRLHKRQDLAYLETLAATTRRVYLGDKAPRKREGGMAVTELDAVYANAQVELPASPKLDLTFLKEIGKVPVCGIQHNGVPIHPVGVNQEGGHVSVSRVFGGSVRNKALIEHALNYFEPAEVEAAVSRFVYTRGTTVGFQRRIREQMSRKCVQIGRMESSALGLKAAPRTAKALGAQIKRLLPVDSSLLPDWNDALEDQILNLKMSNVSTAGAPYWKSKPEALKQALQVIVPMVHTSISEGKLGTLYKEQPELFLCEVRNKLDRYEPTKLQDKVRPYTSLPFHFQALFSCLSQPFSKAMALFHQKKGCANAYGFSWAHGGGEKLEKWAVGCKDGDKPKFCVYGDDADIYYRRKGVLWRLAPDFKQMDGSVDHGTMKLAAEYVYSMFAEKWGENPFWAQVIHLWVEFASNPDFVVSGSSVYNKTQIDGLMTGVVGTTLFDTVKAVFAYDIWADAVCARPELFEEKYAREFFNKMGLEIKAGTWTPEQVKENRAPGEIWSNQKFLGISLMYEQGPERVELVPWLSDEDWLTLFLTPREDPAEGVGKREKPSQLMKQRTMFDRARGYLVTGGFTSPRIRQMLNGMIDSIPLVPIMMVVQAGGGKGEVPEAMSVTEEDFMWPTSEGVPSELWCRNLYFSADNQFASTDAKWQIIAPDMAAILEEFKKNYKPMVPKMVKLEVKLESYRESLVKEEPVVAPPAAPVRKIKGKTLGVSATQVMDTVGSGPDVLVRSSTLTLGVPLEENVSEEDRLVMKGCDPISGESSKKWHKPKEILEHSKQVNIQPVQGASPVVTDTVGDHPTQGQVLKRLFAERSQVLDPLVGDVQVADFIRQEGADDRFARASAAHVVMQWLKTESARRAELFGGTNLMDSVAFVKEAGLRESIACSLLRYIPVPVAADLMGKTNAQIRKLAQAESLVLLSTGPGYILDAYIPSVEPMVGAELTAQLVPRVVVGRVKEIVKTAPETYKAVVEKKLVKVPAPAEVPQPAVILPVSQVDVKQPPPQLTKRFAGWPATPVRLLQQWSESGRITPRLAALAKHAVSRVSYRAMVDGRPAEEEDDLFYEMAARLCLKEHKSVVVSMLRASGIDAGNLGDDSPSGSGQQSPELEPARSPSRTTTSKKKKKNNRGRVKESEDLIDLQQQEDASPPLEPAESVMRGPPTEKVGGAPAMKAKRLLGPAEKLQTILGSPKKVAKGALADHLSMLRAPPTLPVVNMNLPRHVRVGGVYGALVSWFQRNGKRIVCENITCKAEEGGGVVSRVYIHSDTDKSDRQYWFEERGFNSSETREKVVDNVLGFMGEQIEEGNVDERVNIQDIIDTSERNLHKAGGPGVSGVLRRGTETLFEFEGNTFTPVKNLEGCGKFWEVGDAQWMWQPEGSQQPINLTFSRARTQASVLKTIQRFIPDLELARYV